MRTLLSYLFTPIYHIYFGLLLVIFHPIQSGARLLAGDKARKFVIDVLNVLLVRGLHILGCRIKFSGFEKIPVNRPIIIVSNHQSLYDIPSIVVGFRKFYPRFISKKELGKNIPSVSSNLKYSKSALIDRKSGSQSVKEIFKLGRLIEQHKHAACIFPEGTRSKTGKVRKFMPAGVGTLLRAAPSSIIIPYVIDGHSQLMSKGMFPLRFGQKIKYTVLDPIEPKGKPIEEIVNQVEIAIKKELNQ